MAAMLSPEDLKAFAAAPTEDKRIAMAEQVVSAIRHGGLSAAEFTIAEDVLALMARDAAEKVRESLSEIVASVPDVPRGVIQALAQDFDRVAMPVLRHSPHLTDAELIEIVRSGSTAKQTAIARRPVVSEVLAETIVNEAGEVPVSALMSNAGAQVTPAILDQAIDRFSGSEAVQQGIVRRADLPVTVAERLISMVSDRLRDYLIARRDLPKSVAHTIAQHSRERATISLFDTYGRGRNIGLVIKQLAQAKKLTPSLILRAACTGDMRFFEGAMIELSGLPPKEAWSLIHSEGARGIGELVGMCHLPAVMTPVLVTAVECYHTLDFDGGDQDRERFRQRMIQLVLTKCQDMAKDDLNYLLLKVDQLSKDIRIKEAV